MKIIISEPSQQDNYSVLQLYNNICTVLSEKHEVINMPVFEGMDSLERKAWIEQNQDNCQLLITSNPMVIQSFRESSWRGSVILNSLGDLPRGAVGLRTALPYLKTTDVLWHSSSSDRAIIESLLDKDFLPQLKFIPYGVKDNIFYPQQDKLKCRSILGWEHDEFILVYSGRITAEKNIHALYEALYYLNRLSNLKFRLVLIGQIINTPFYEFNLRFTDLEQKLQTIERNYQLENLITHIQWMSQAELNIVYNASDLFVNLTLHHDENYGFSQVEAMSAGLPVVCTAWGGLRDTVVDYEGGFTCNTWITSSGVRYDLPKFIQSVYQLATNRSLLKAQSKAARARVNTHYSQSRFAENMLQAIEEIRQLNNNDSRVVRPAFSAFGQQYNERFSTFYESHKRHLPSIPIYNGFDDSDYRKIISAYASACEISKQQLFVCLNGVIRGNYYYSQDLLWPIRKLITSEELELLGLLSRVSYTKIEGQQSKLIEQLLDKGLIGCAYQ